MPDKIYVYDLTGVVEREIEKPIIFRFPVREDVIFKVFTHQQSHRIQPKGRYPRAGRDRSAEFFGVGLGLARIPRIKHGPLRGTGAIVTMTRGGRRPHVTTPEKRVYKRINRKELRLAVASAVSATGVKDLIERRGHVIDRIPSFPVIVSDEVESLTKTPELMEVLDKLGFTEDINRVKENIKIVGGKAAWRGRRRKVRVGPLIVYAEDNGIVKAGRNIIGVDVVSADDVSVIHLAPGGVPGRLTLWTETAVDRVARRLDNVLRRYVVI